MKRALQYVDDIKKGKIKSCRYVKLAIARFEKDLARKDLKFDGQRVQRVIDFIQLLKHTVGKFENKPFILSDWQVFIIANLYGFYNLNGTRRYTSAYIELARKGGKTAFVAALALYALSADGEGGAEVLLAANSKEQAKIAFNIASNFVKKVDKKGKYYKPYRNEVKFDHTNSKMMVLAADATKLDGLNCSCGIVDEYHSAPNSSVRDAISSSQGMRENPQLLTITTAGFNKTFPCFLLRQTNIEVLEGLKYDDSAFCMIYTIDEGHDWQDPDNWIKSNPNLGITVTKKYLADQVLKAKNNPSEEVNILTKNFNVWCDSSSVWIPSHFITSNSADLHLDYFTGAKCFVGVDLASVQDLTAVAYTLIHEGQIYVFIRFFIPEESLNTRIDKETYRLWVKQGYLQVTPGNVTDYDYITRDILEVGKILRIKKIAYDSWNSTQWATQATVLKLPIEPYSQTVGNFNGPTRELERLTMTGKVTFDNNPILRWNFGNVTIRTDANGNIKPDKAKSISKIDGIIATIQGVAMLIEDSRKVKSRITL